MTCGLGPELESFTLECTYSEASEIYLRPISDGALLSFYHTLMLENWNCVSEEVCDNNTTMVWWDYPAEASETYCLQDVSIPSDYSINSIIVTAKTLCDIAYDEDMVYKLIITDNSECLYGELGDVYESTEFDIKCNTGGISGNFGTIAFPWAENPRTGLPWTNDDLNNLQIGMICKSKVMSYDDNTYCWLDGSSDGSILQLTLAGTTNHYECFQQGGWSTIYARNNAISTWQTDLINMEHEYNPILGYPKYFDLSTHIRRVRLYLETYKELPTDACKAKCVCKTHGIVYYGPERTQTQGTDAIAINWYTNPFTGVDWTWQEVLDAQFGIALYSTSGSNYLRVYGCETLVIYDKAITTTIATSQIYAKVNLTAYSTTSTKLPKPSEISLDHDIETKSLNFQSGNRKTYGLRRNNKKIMMTGLMWDGCIDGVSTCDEIIYSIREMAKRLEPVTISGLKYTQYNTTYNIIDFNPVQVQEKPILYKWELVLEFCS